MVTGGETRAGVALTNLDQPLFAGLRGDQARPGRLPGRGSVTGSSRSCGDGRCRSCECCAARPRSCRRTCLSTRRTGSVPCRCGRRARAAGVTYALCDDRRTLLWFANQRAVEYHPGLMRCGSRRTRGCAWCSTWTRRRRPRSGWPSRPRSWSARRWPQAGLAGAVKASGAKGVHVFVPVAASVAPTWPRRRGHRGARGAAGPGPGHDGVHPGGPRRQGVPGLDPGRRRRWPPRTARGSGPARRSRSRSGGPTWTGPPRPTSRCARPRAAGRRRPWAAALPAPQQPSPELIEEGRAIPVARVQAMHEGNPRPARRDAAEPPEQ